MAHTILRRAVERHKERTQVTTGKAAETESSKMKFLMGLTPKFYLQVTQHPKVKELPALFHCRFLYQSANVTVEALMASGAAKPRAKDG
jgi:hypothetical protein